MAVANPSTRGTFGPHRYRTAVWESDLPSTMRAVALHMLDRAAGRDDLVCWPSAQTVARCTGYSLRAVKGALAALRALGWLVDTGRRHGPTGRVIEHQLRIPKGPNGAAVSTNGAGAAPLMVQEVHLEEIKEEIMNNNMSEQPSTDPTEEDDTMSDNHEQPPLFGAPARPSGEAKTDGPTDTATPPTDPPRKSDDPWRETMTLWSTLAKEHGKRGTPYQRTSPTGKALQARIDEHGAEAVAEVIRWYWRSHSDRALFLRDGGYTLTTLMRPDNCVAYLELSHGDPSAQPRGPAKVVPMDEGRDRLLEWRRKMALRQFGGGE